MNRKKNLPVYIAAFLLFAGGIGYLVYSGLSENSVYFLNVSEARAAEPDKLAQARLFGTVGENGRSHQGRELAFQLQDKDNPREIISVVYRGILPDTFKPGAEVIVEGGITPEGHFSAKSLMTKCPSKYQTENRKI